MSPAQEPFPKPFIGDELVSVVMSTPTIELHFQRDMIQIGGHFALLRPSHADEQFEPQNRLGAVQALWPLIGRLVASTRWGSDWGDTVELVFDNAVLIRILPVPHGFRGTIHGKFPPPDAWQIQDF